MRPQSVVLKEQLVLERTKAESLLAVRNLNLWGEGFTDVSIVEKIPGIEVLALAANQLTTLRPFASCTSLRELYLRKNDIKSLAEVKYIKDLPNLRTLWLMDNPCAKSPEYRSFVILCCQHLKQLDNIEVTEHEREEAKRRLSEKTVLDILNSGNNDGGGVDGGSRTENSSSVTGPTEGKSSVIGQRRLRRGGGGDSRMSYDSENDLAKGSNNTRISNGMPCTTAQTQRAILTAIGSLISELTLESLNVLREEVNGEMGRREKAMGQRSRDQ